MRCESLVFRKAVRIKRAKAIAEIIMYTNREYESVSNCAPLISVTMKESQRYAPSKKTVTTITFLSL